MTRGSHAAVTRPSPAARPSRRRAVVGALAVALVLAAGGPAAAQIGPTDPTTPGGGGIGEPTGRETTTTTTEADEPAEPTTTSTTEASAPTTTRPERTTPGRDLDLDDDVDTDDDGASPVALIAVGLVGLLLGALLAGLPLGLALGRRKPAPAPAPGAALTPPPAPAAVPAAGPQIGTPPSRDEAQVRSQRAELAEALMALRDQVPSAALAEEAGRALAAVGITEIRPDGQRFDPAAHRAVDQVATDDPARHDTVASTERPGYADGTRIVRLPEVVVARHGGQP